MITHQRRTQEINGEETYRCQERRHQHIACHRGSNEDPIKHKCEITRKRNQHNPIEVIT